MLLSYVVGETAGNLVYDIGIPTPAALRSIAGALKNLFRNPSKLVDESINFVDDLAGTNAPKGAFGGTGTYSGRPFDPSNAGGPIRHLTTDRIKVTGRGVDLVEKHLSRFDDYAPNQQMLDRLRRIERGELTPTQTDLNFYSHELREFVRYRRQGWRTGAPDDLDARHTLWENAHTATLEDYRLLEGPGVLYFQSR